MALYRRGTAADSRLVYDIFETTIDDLARRTGGNANSTADDPEAWQVRQPLFEHLAATGDEWWIAEDETSRLPIGYARSIVRDGVRELTEFFVLPTAQARGVGRELLSRAFPADVGHRAIVSTIDPRAIARYLGTGLSARASIAGFEAAPRPISIDSDLERSPIEPGSLPLDALGDIDRAILGFRRDVDHRWLATQRRGWIYRRAGAAVGYAYHPSRPLWGGPYATLDARDLPRVLADAESAAATAGHASVSFDLPLVARSGIDHLLARGFRIDPFVMLYFTDGPIEGLDRYVLTSPPFFA